MENNLRSVFRKIEFIFGILSLISIIGSYFISRSDLDEIIKTISVSLAISFSASFALTLTLHISITKIFITYNQEVDVKIENSFNKYIENQNNYHDKVYHQIINNFQSQPNSDSYETEVNQIIRLVHSIKTILKPTKEFVEENISSFGKSSFTVGGTIHFYNRHEEDIINNIEKTIKLIEEIIVAFVPYEIKDRVHTEGIKNVKSKMNMHRLVNSLKVDKDNFDKIIHKYNVDKNRFFLRDKNLYEMSNYIDITLNSIEDGLKKVSAVSNTME